MEQDTAEGLARIRCGCGFEVVGEHQPSNVEAFDMHNCPNKPPRRWHQSLFSVWGAAIVLLLVLLAEELLVPLVVGAK